MGEYGYDVGHEVLRADGVSAWTWAVRSTNIPNWGSPVIDTDNTAYGFNNVIQVVRHPLKCLASVLYTDQPNVEALRYRQRYCLIQGNDYEKALMSVVGWNKLVKALKPDAIIKVEEARVKLAEYLNTNPVKKEQKVKRVNSRSHPGVTLKELKTNVSPNLFAAFEQHCAEYDYEL